MLAKAQVRETYEQLEGEFSIAEELVKARLKAGLSQAEVAELMKTQTPAISRIESPDSKHSPSLRTLRKYATAVGCDLKIRLVPSKRVRQASGYQV
jgi:transcriptional regulator with XRE-family HTH domain